MPCARNPLDQLREGALEAARASPNRYRKTSIWPADRTGCRKTRRKTDEAEYTSRPAARVRAHPPAQRSNENHPEHASAVQSKGPVDRDLYKDATAACSLDPAPGLARLAKENINHE